MGPCSKSRSRPWRVAEGGPASLGRGPWGRTNSMDMVLTDKVGGKAGDRVWDPFPQVFPHRHQSILYFCDQVLGIISGGFIFHTENQKKKWRISKARIFFYFNTSCSPRGCSDCCRKYGVGFAGKKQSRGKVKPAALGSLKLVFTGFLLTFHPFLLSKRLITILCATSDFLIFPPKWL